MKKCLELAILGTDSVKSNPLVGCVIVLNNEIIAEGYHKDYGGPHAEVNAINKIKNKEILKNATLYVNLEPCSHYGKTPPCINIIIENKIKEIVIANHDPFCMVNGKGIRALKKHANVITGVLEKEAYNINKKYFNRKKQNKPYIILKWAESKDGFINDISPGITQISDDKSIYLSHKWRNEIDAILVGSNTIMCDNPLLTTRYIKNGANPIRVTIDMRNRLTHLNYNIFNSDAKTIVFNKSLNKQIDNIQYIKISKNDILVTSKLKYILSTLYKLNIKSIIIEGGAILINQFINENLWDEARVFASKKIIKKGIKAPILEKLENIKKLKNNFIKIGKDKLYILSK